MITVTAQDLSFRKLQITQKQEVQFRALNHCSSPYKWLSMSQGEHLHGSYYKIHDSWNQGGPQTSSLPSSGRHMLTSNPLPLKKKIKSKTFFTLKMWTKKSSKTNQLILKEHILLSLMGIGKNKPNLIWKSHCLMHYKKAPKWWPQKIKLCVYKTCIFAPILYIVIYEADQNRNRSLNFPGNYQHQWRFCSSKTDTKKGRKV